MPSLPALSSMSRPRPDVAGEHGNPPEVQPRRFDRPGDAVLARLDAFELELILKLRPPEPSSAARLPLGEIVRLVAGTSFVCLAARVRQLAR